MVLKEVTVKVHEIHERLVRTDVRNDKYLYNN